MLEFRVHFKRFAIIKLINSLYTIKAIFIGCLYLEKICIYQKIT